MLTLKGIYDNGTVKFDEEISVDSPVEVSVTFLEDVEKKPRRRLMLSDFSFAESREVLKDFKGSLSDSVIEERRDAL